MISMAFLFAAPVWRDVHLEDEMLQGGCGLQSVR
jgi:hypothetical protein